MRHLTANYAGHVQQYALRRLRLAQLDAQRCEPPAQRGKVGLHNAPDTSVINLIVAIDEHVAKRHDPAQLRNTCGQALIYPRKLAQCLPIIASWRSTAERNIRSSA